MQDLFGMGFRVVEVMPVPERQTIYVTQDVDPFSEASTAHALELPFETAEEQAQGDRAKTKHRLYQQIFGADNVLQVPVTPEIARQFNHLHTDGLVALMIRDS